MRLVSALLGLSLVLSPAGARGEDEAPRIPPGEDRIEAVTSLTPRLQFTGMLLDTDTAIRWTNARLWYAERIRLMTRFHAEELEAVRSHGTAAQNIIGASYEREINGLRQDLRQQAARFAQELNAARRETPWYKTYTFGLLTGVVVTVVVVGLTAWAVSSVN